jgi:hypothetical protein
MNTSVDAGLPVLVWFHGQSWLHFSCLHYSEMDLVGKTGGGYSSGDTHTYYPNLLMNSSARPFVFASFEYRLGQFGFLGQFSTFASIWTQFHRSFKEEARYMTMEFSMLDFLIRYITHPLYTRLKAVLPTHLREQHWNGSKDIFITLVVIQGYLTYSSYTTHNTL